MEGTGASQHASGLHSAPAPTSVVPSSVFFFFWDHCWHRGRFVRCPLHSNAPPNHCAGCQTMHNVY